MRGPSSFSKNRSLIVTQNVSPHFNLLEERTKFKHSFLPSSGQAWLPGKYDFVSLPSTLMLSAFY